MYDSSDFDNKWIGLLFGGDFSETYLVTLTYEKVGLQGGPSYSSLEKAWSENKVT
jgi:hypothetical protein